MTQVWNVTGTMVRTMVRWCLLDLKYEIGPKEFIVLGLCLGFFECFWFVWSFAHFLIHFLNLQLTFEGWGCKTFLDCKEVTAILTFFIFRHRFRIMSPKFRKFERVQNFSENFWKLLKRKGKIKEMEQRIFCIFINYRGNHRKGVAIYEANSVNLQSKPWFHWTKIIFNEYYRELQTIKKPLMDIIFVMKIFFWWHVQSCPLWVYVSTTQRCAVPLNEMEEDQL